MSNSLFVSLLNEISRHRPWRGSPTGLRPTQATSKRTISASLYRFYPASPIYRVQHGGLSLFRLSPANPRADWRWRARGTALAPSVWLSLFSFMISLFCPPISILPSSYFIDRNVLPNETPCVEENDWHVQIKGEELIHSRWGREICLSPAIWNSDDWKPSH